MREVYEFDCPNCGVRIAEKTLRPGDLKRCRACKEKVIIPEPPLPPLDERPNGAALAERVADYLQAGGEIPPRHPYFEGVCLAYLYGEFLYGYAYEGGAPAFVEGDPVLRRFADRAGFVAWLAAESDLSINRGPGAGLRSPREIGITRRRLEAAVDPNASS